MQDALNNISDEIIAPQQFVNWENLSRKSLLDGPEEMHLLVDLPWLTILKILIEVELWSILIK